MNVKKKLIEAYGRHKTKAAESLKYCISYMKDRN